MISIKQNKKGFLLGEFTLKVIIAVLCLSLLVYLLFAIYGSFIGEEQLKKADATLGKIVETAELLKEGKSETVILIEPVSTMKFSKTSVASVDACASNCLCLEVYLGSMEKGPLKRNRNVCRQIDNEVILKNEVKIEKIGTPITISIKKEGGQYAIEKV